MKNLSQDELRQLEQAKQNEIRLYLQNEVMEAPKGNEEIRDDELMGMRWVVTVKHFTGKNGQGEVRCTGPSSWRLGKTGCWERQHPHQHVVQSSVSCKGQHIMVPSSRRKTCRELSCKVANNRLTGTWFQ